MRRFSHPATRSWAAFAATASLLFPAIPCPASPPNAVSLQGALENAAGAPLTGDRAYRVRFFDGPASPVQIGADATGVASLDDRGRFGFEVAVPAAALAAADLRYELAIDLDDPPDGVDAGDVFPDRARAASVPFALLASDAERLGGVEAAAFSPRQRGAIVDDDGPADYATIQAAVAAGENSIFVRDGVYTLNGDLTIPFAPFSLVGESTEGVVIRGTSALGAFSIVYAGDVGVYSVGSVAATDGSTTVASTSGAPAWLTNAFPGETIRIGRSFHTIASVQSDSSLTLTAAYRGRTVSGESYSISTYGAGFRFENFTLLNPRDAANNNQNATQGGICLRHARRIVVRDCRALVVSPGSFGHLAYFENCHDARVEGCSTEGVALLNAANCAAISVVDNSVRGARTTAISLSGRSDDDAAFDLTVANNRVSGGSATSAIRLQQPVSSVPLFGVVANNTISEFSSNSAANNEGAILIQATTGGVAIAGNNVTRCAGTALALVGAQERLSITGNVFTDNGGFGVRGMSATGTTNSVMTSNVMVGNAMGTNVTTVNGTMNLPRYEVPVP